MIFTDETITVMTDYFQMGELERLKFINRIRTLQMTTMWQSIFSYVEETTTEVRQNYIQKLMEEARDDKTALKKFNKYIATLIGNDPELLHVIIEKQNLIIKTLLDEFSLIADEETVVKLMRSIFKNIDVIAGAMKKGYLPSSTGYLQLKEN